MISETPSIWEPQISSFGWRNVEETLATFGVSFSKPFLLQMGYSQLSKILTFCIFYISVFVNTTAMVVNSCAILYMCLDSYSLAIWIGPHQRVMISQTPSIGELQISLGGRRKCGGNSCNFWGEFFKTLSSPKWDIPNFPKFWHFASFTFLYLSILQPRIVNTYAILYMCMDSYNLSICIAPYERLMISQTPGMGEPQHQLRWEKECGGKLFQLLALNLAKSCLLKTGYS